MTEDDELIREQVSRSWAADWDNPDDATYDAEQGRRS